MLYLNKDNIMLLSLIYFILALALLLVAANYFTNSAEVLGKWLKLPSFVIGVFIVGIGTSLPELVSGVVSVRKDLSAIVPGNIMGANISNLLLITGLAVILNKRPILLLSENLYIDLHFLIGGFIYFFIIAYNGQIVFAEACIGILIYIVYAIYLIRGGTSQQDIEVTEVSTKFPYSHVLLLLATSVGIYFGASFTVEHLEIIAVSLQIPTSIISLTLLSLGTTLPELAVNVAAIRNGKAEMAIGNVLGSSVFNTLFIPPVVSMFGAIEVPETLISFSLPVMIFAGVLFYMLTQDKRISVWEGMMFLCLYVLFILQVAGVS
jgi:cation:H+ antiporter